MKAVILAGGFGTRLSEETISKPKPMIEIGEQPILWHIMKTYSHFGFNDFIVCLGYKGYMIKEFFNIVTIMVYITIHPQNPKNFSYVCFKQIRIIPMLEQGRGCLGGR